MSRADLRSNRNRVSRAVAGHGGGVGAASPTLILEFGRSGGHHEKNNTITESAERPAGR